MFWQKGNRSGVLGGAATAKQFLGKCPAVPGELPPWELLGSSRRQPRPRKTRQFLKNCSTAQPLRERPGAAEPALAFGGLAAQALVSSWVPWPFLGSFNGLPGFPGLPWAPKAPRASLASFKRIPWAPSENPLASPGLRNDCDCLIEKCSCLLRT